MVFWGKATKARAYVDGFNLYFRALKDRPEFKWLDVARMVSLAYPDDEILSVAYFTAHIKNDYRKQLRQKAYLLALASTPLVRVEVGFYQTTTSERPLADPAEHRRLVSVILETEKRSDVNLACDMIMDAIAGEAHAEEAYDKAILVSDDSDQLAPIGILRKRFGLSVAVLSPDPKAGNLGLKTAASSYKAIQVEWLAGSQLPKTVQTPRGTISRPEAWYAPPAAAPQPEEPAAGA